MTQRFLVMDSDDQLLAFKALVQVVTPLAATQAPSKFVKKIDEIPYVDLSPSDPC